MAQHFYELFSTSVDQHANRIAIEVQRRDGLDALTYAELREMAERTAAWLALIGIAPGDRCAILSDNHSHWCAAYLGILRRGAVAVPLDTAYKASQVETLLRDSGARVMFTSARFLPVVLEARTAASSDLRIVMLHGEHEAGVSFEAMTRGRLPAPPLPVCPATPSDPAVTLYTSGTTSDPKGVVLTHANLIAERTAVFETVKVTEQDCILGVLPLFHALAQMANLLLPLSVGARVVFLESVNTTELLRALRQRGVTVFACVPQFFYLIHQRVADEVGRRSAVTRAVVRTMRRLNTRLRGFGINLGPVLFRKVHAVLGGRIRFMVTGGSKFDPQIGADLYAMGFDILQAYGLTETSGAATLMRPGDSHLETVGHPLPGVDIRIGPAEAGDEHETDGEVLIRGPVVMQGYFNRPDATAAALKDGWLHTGDLGRIDAAGRLLITGRRKELIVLQLGQEHLPGRDRSGLSHITLREGDLRPRPQPSGRAGRRAALCRRRPEPGSAARAQGGQRRRPDAIRDGRRSGAPSASQAGARLRNLDGSAAAHHDWEDSAVRSGASGAGCDRETRIAWRAGGLE